jgi:serine/threonine protein kinase
MVIETGLSKPIIVISMVLGLILVLGMMWAIFAPLITEIRTASTSASVDLLYADYEDEEEDEEDYWLAQIRSESPERVSRTPHPPSNKKDNENDTFITKHGYHPDESTIETSLLTETKVTGFDEKRFVKGELFTDAGGMKLVYHAKDMDTGKKLVWKQASDHKNMPINICNSRLKYEVEILRMIDHNRIPTLMASGQSNDGRGNNVEVLIEEFIEGDTLHEHLSPATKFTYDEAIKHILELCEPLEKLAALDSPIYHRDLKPQNIIMHPKRGPVIIDFGGAKLDSNKVLVTSVALGSGGWTAPERDEISGTFTDVYSIGKILFCMLNGQASPPRVIDEKDIPKLTSIGVPLWLSSVIVEACRQRSEDRIQTVSLLASRLREEGAPIESDGDNEKSDFKAMKVKELREELRTRGLPLIGSKSQLILRLSKYENMETE